MFSHFQVSFQSSLKQNHATSSQTSKSLLHSFDASVEILTIKMTSYTVIVQEEDPQLSQLSQNHYNLQVAKAVSSGGGPPQFTMVYMSTVLAPVMSIGWTVTYGLNWTTEIPSPGASVIYGGRWQQCDFGSSYDLNETGSWSVNNNDSNKDSKSLNVGRNGYSEAVHMMVGVKNTHGEWKPVRPTRTSSLMNTAKFASRSLLTRTRFCPTCTATTSLSNGSSSGGKKSL
jgi:hypothetical protein